jgi:hypothetical protein
MIFYTLYKLSAIAPDRPVYAFLSFRTNRALKRPLHVPLDETRINKLTKPDQLKNYKLVILPDLRYIPDDKISIIDEFARQGGIVLASGEAALYTERYEPRQVMPLRCMGVEKLLYHRKDVISAMLSVEDPRDKKTFVRFGSADYIVSVQDHPRRGNPPL